MSLGGGRKLKNPPEFLIKYKAVFRIRIPNPSDPLFFSDPDPFRK